LQNPKCTFLEHRQARQYKHLSPNFEVLESAKEKLLKQLAIEDTEELVTDREVTQEEIDQEEEEPKNEWENGVIVKHWMLSLNIKRIRMGLWLNEFV
jgi:hypothetical protein